MKSSTELVRQGNCALVLAALRRHGELSHTDIADRTHLSSATISAITADLERAQVIVKTEQQASSGRGRPRVLFSQCRDCGYLIVLIISSDAMEYSLVDYSGRLIDRFSMGRTGISHGIAGFGLAIREGLERVVQRSQLTRDSVLAISISSKGLVDPQGAVLLWSPVLGDERMDFERLLRPDWAARIMLSNETLLVASALGLRAEREASDRSPFRALAALSLGHSIGLGIVRHSGHGENSVVAPNFGHMLHLSHGALCRCGARGCVEAYAGFYAILRTAFEVPTDTLPAKFVPLAEVDKIAVSARQGNRTAGYAFRQAGLALGNGLSRVLSLHERMPIAVTGPGTRYYDLLRQGIEDGLADAQAVRLEGLPVITVVPDEPGLVFEGHLNQALTGIDQDIVSTRLRPDIETARARA